MGQPGYFTGTRGNKPSQADRLLAALDKLTPDERYALAVVNELTSSQRLRIQECIRIAVRVLREVSHD